jgi:predicted RND superfamily exporter protein
MSSLSELIIKRKKAVMWLFALAAAASVFMAGFVRVSYKLAEYLPKNAPSIVALNKMQAEFGNGYPNARVMLKDVAPQEALRYKRELLAIDGVASAVWLDDVVGSDALATTPLEFMDQSVVSAYYKDGSALIYISIESGKEADAVGEIRRFIGESNAIAGEAVNTASSQELSESETLKAMAILIPVILLILIFSTTSWAEPLLFLITIGLAVLINMGTNIFFGKISFITSAVSPILQLAVSLDYAIFLTHSFGDLRLQGHKPEEAMKLAMKKSIAAIAASAATTVVGFFALIFMRLGIGYDLGINLVKGVLLSFISVTVFMPALTLSCRGLIDRTRHRRFLPDFSKAGALLLKIRIPFFLLALAAAVPCFLAQSKLDFKYGMDIYGKESRAGKDAAQIEDRFGGDNQLVLLVPKGSPGTEAELCRTLGRLEHVTSVVSYSTAVGSEIPEEYLSEEQSGQFYSENYSRIILYTDTKTDGEEAFSTVRAVKAAAASLYGESWLSGQSAILYDMQSIVPDDAKTVDYIAIIGIFIVLLLTFKSLSLPVLLLFTIETAIFINLSFAYFTGSTYNFIGYLVISTVQLGATVDYAILLTDRYIGLRKDFSKKEAMAKALGGNVSSILISAAYSRCRASPWRPPPQTRS